VLRRLSISDRIGALVFALLATTAEVVAAAPPSKIERSPQLRSVRLRPRDGSIQVIFVLSGPVRYRLTRTNDEAARITLDLLDARISPVFTKRELLSEHAALIRVLLSASPGGTRVVLDLAAAGRHTIYPADDQLIVEISVLAPAPGRRATAAPLSAAPLPSVGRGLPGTSPQLAGAVDDEADTRSESNPRLVVPWVPLGPRVEDLIAANGHPVGTRVVDFRQREPGDGSPASQQTTAYVAYDSEYLYAAFVCRDRPADVRTHLVPRDAIVEDDQVALYLDTFHDGRHAYVFASNPFGVQQDGVISEGDDASFTADMLWRSQGRVTREGYVVLMAIPFKSLRFSPGPVQNWRIAFSRTIARTNEHAFWPYITRRANGFVRQMASLDGLELISPGRNVQLIPYGTFARAESFGSPGTMVSELRHAGVDAKVVVKNAVTIDAALNPDFSEVEADDPLVAVNQRFELFLPEKRPFFMENAALFETPINVMFSRRIANPDGGVRVTARSSGWAVGGLVANDRPSFSSRPDLPFASGARIGVARLQRLFGDRSNVGVLATERDDGLSRNRVLSVDSRVQITPAWSFSGQAVRSDERVDRDRLRRDGAYSAAVSRTGPRFTYVASYRDVGDTLSVPLGFVPRRDIRATDQYAGYVWRVGESGAWSFGPAVTTVIDWNHAGQLQDRWASIDGGASLAGQLDLHVSRSRGYELYATRPFDTNATNVSVTSTASRRWSFWTMYSWGTAINYTPAAGVEPFPGSKFAAYSSITFRPSVRLNLEQLLMHERLDTGRDALEGSRLMVFDTTLMRSKANLQLTRALSLRAILDYSQLDANAALFSETGSSRLMHDLLVRYVLHPGTAVHVGFNRRYDSTIADPRSDSPPTGLWQLTALPAGQQLFVKMSYLVRF